MIDASVGVERLGFAHVSTEPKYTSLQHAILRPNAGDRLLASQGEHEHGIRAGRLDDIDVAFEAKISGLATLSARSAPLAADRAEGPGRRRLRRPP